LWTFFSAADLFVWLLENILLFMMVATAVITYRRYPLSQKSYLLLITFLILHLYGARYTYESNPLGHWLQHLSGGSRNSYDRIVHFSFGLLWTYALLEIILKYIKLDYNLSAILSFACISTLAAFYEIIEWVIGGIFFPEQGTEFLGMQGDQWDTQKDMLLALAGSLISIGYIYFMKNR
jgi:putative membrane protein